MVSHGNMQEEGAGFWRKAAVSLTLLAGVAFAALAPGRLSDVYDTLFPPPPPPAIPSAAADRSHLVAQLAPPSASPGPDAVHTLWRLSGDENHYVRGQALEALAQAGEGARMDPRRAERMREIATDDTDWNRRSACVLLIQYDTATSLKHCAPLWAKTQNANTKAALVDALWAADATTALGAAAQAKEPEQLAPFVRDVLDAFKARSTANVH
jgi:hypothetical protein